MTFNSVLIQRLLKPYNSDKDKLNYFSESFSFGGGYINGGLSKEAMNLLRPIFRFDYMGRAEYEFGALAEAFKNIYVKRNEYIYFKKQIKYKLEDWFSKTPKIIEGEKVIYFICNSKDKNKVINNVSLLARNSNFKTVRTKMPSFFAENLALEENRLSTPAFGWLDITNNFFFFRDETMFQKTCSLFEIVNQEVKI